MYTTRCPPLLNTRKWECIHISKLATLASQLQLLAISFDIDTNDDELKSLSRNVWVVLVPVTLLLKTPTASRQAKGRCTTLDARGVSIYQHYEINTSPELPRMEYTSYVEIVSQSGTSGRWLRYLPLLWMSAPRTRPPWHPLAYMSL